MTFALSTPLEAPRFRILSLGLGVQSTTLALMAAHGEFGHMPDMAIFADTGAEPTPIYEQLKWLQSGNVLPFPIHIISAGNMREETLRAVDGESGFHSRPPFHVLNPDGSAGMIRRQCTQDFKIEPIIKEVRRIVGLARGRKGPANPIVEQWIGISRDEIQRAANSRVRWIHNRFPLLEKDMRRSDCMAWLERHGYEVPPKSACSECPFRSNSEWRWLRDNDPAGWDSAVQVDRALRKEGNKIPLDGQLFVHRDRVPLDQADISSDEERGQMGFWGVGEECQGMCGV